MILFRYRQARRSARCLAAALLVLFVAASADAATINKANNTNNLNLTTSWTGGVVPGSTDIALWNSTVLGANSVSLGSNLNFGEIQVTNPGGLVTLTNTGGFTLTLSGVSGVGIDMSTATQNLTINSLVSLGGAQSWNVATGRTLTIGGNIGGSGALTLSGASSTANFALNGTNNYSGGTTITGGTVTIGTSSALGTGGLSMSGGTLDLNGKGAIALANLSGSGGTITNANVNTATTLTVGSDNTNTTFGGTLTDGNGQRALSLVKTGTGVLTLSGANTNNNINGQTTISGGVLRLNNASALPSSGLTINGGVLELQTPSSFTASLGPGTATANQVQITGGISGFSAFGSAATINLNNNASTVQWGSATFNPTALVLNETTATAALTFQNGIDLNAATRTINVNANTATITGAIVNNGGGTAGLNKGGTGTLKLTNNNTYNGATTISANGGTLEINNSNSSSSGRLSATSNVTVNSGGTVLLSGSSSWTDRINDSATMTLNGGTFNTGGLTEAGGSTGTRTAGIGALTLTANSTIDFGTGNSIIEFAGLGAHTAGTGPDLAILNWTGTLFTPGGTDQLLFAGTTTDFTSKFDQSDVSFNGIDGYTAIQIAAGYYEIVAVPEPSTWLAAALALSAIGFSQRKRLRACASSAVSILNS